MMCVDVVYLIESWY